MTRRELLILAGTLAVGGWRSVAGDRLAEIVADIHEQDLGKLPIGELVAKVGQMLIGTPYFGGVLDEDADRERCVIDLERLDCVTFYELSLDIARMVKRGRSTSADLVNEVALTRYRGGKMDGYVSRLHYTTDWIRDNAARGIVRSITDDMPASQPITKPIDYMTKHPDKYRALAAHPEWVPLLQVHERRLLAAKPTYIPTDRAPEAELGLRTGDIVGITTSAEGLDCSHTGLILIQDGVPKLLHASSTAKRVVLGPQLSKYLADNPKATGYLAARPLEPR